MIKPQLACDADVEKMKFPCWGFPKLDGVRLINLSGNATGRSLKPHGNLHITAKYSEQHFLGLDGEITYGDTRGESLCRDTTSVMSRIQGEPDVVWNIFDYLAPEIVNLPYKERYKAAEKLVEKFCFANVVMIPWTLIESVEEAEDFYDKQLDLGYEGAVFRDFEAYHKSGRATAKESSYTRMKPQSDKEARVLRLVEAQENLNEAKTNALGRTERSSHKENKVGKGMVGMLVCWDDELGMEIDVSAGKMTHEERIYYWDHPEEIIQEYIKYRSMDKGVKDKPRFARYICRRALSDMS